MKSVRKFFGHLCGRSGRRADQNKGDSPVTPLRQDEEKQIEPTLLADDVQGGGEKKDETLKEYFTQSSYESLSESPSCRRKQNVKKPVGSIKFIYDVTEWKPENLGAPPADKVFSNAAEILAPFHKETEHMAALLLKFSRQYSKDKKPDFLKCFQVYLKNKAEDGSDDVCLDDEQNLLDVSDDCLTDPTAKQLKEIAVNGKRISELVDSIRPQIAEKVEEASKYDVKEAGKEKKDDTSGNQGGLLSKFSAPGKFRRNLKQLKENHKLLDLVHSEVESILLAISSDKTRIKNPTASNQELYRSGSPTILDTAASDEPSCPDDVVIITDPHPEPYPEPPCDTTEHSGPDEGEVKHDEPPTSSYPVVVCTEGDVLQVIEEKETGDIDVMSHETHEEAAENDADLIEPTHADLVEHERADIISPLPSDPPVSPQNQVKSDYLDNVDASRLLDFGSYIFVDPSMNDEVVMRASRSLDSLCSVSSRRTLSLYGSYEFVTDFELKIAEKAEDQRQKMTESRTPKKTKSKRTKKSKTTKKSESRGVSSPIYKYTEIDYNPMGF